MLQSPTPYTAITLTVKRQTPSIAGHVLIKGFGVKFLFSRQWLVSFRGRDGRLKHDGLSLAHSAGTTSTHFWAVKRKLGAQI